jgi:chromosome segregation ATPase
LKTELAGSLVCDSGGVNYITMPPTKRFRDMDQLSGAHGCW